MKVRDAIKLIESDGWGLIRTRGRTDLAPKTVASILKQAGLK
jgi:predicted RNA binding protein YcfA (HicA-like mRNA interferase family)